jgi:Na+/H+ antiporter NhaD/arsenite permease-like protein
MAASSPHASTVQLGWRGLVAVVASVCAGAIAWMAGFESSQQVLATSIFVLIIAATLFFWNFRLAIAFIGIAILLGARVLSLDEMVRSAELDIILFLVGMMTIVGVLKDLGLFTWVIQLVINMRRVNGLSFTIILAVMAALMACVVDEVTSIVFVLALVFQVSDTLKLNPTPFVMIAVIATNIGSSGTMLGNPVGILIGTKGGFAFGDFLVWATPVMVVSLLVALGLILVLYRADIHQLSERLEARRQMQLGLGPLVRVPYRRGLSILIAAVTFIALHHKIEIALGVAKNTMLIVAPLAIAGVLMIYRHERARHYIESEVEWWTLLFFMMLFSVAGALEHTGVTAGIASSFKTTFGTNPLLLTPLVIGITALGSALVDNIVFVAAFIPVIKSIGITQLWWALLFGACFGGNITAIGSTANIVALGMMEKRYRMQVAFMAWLKIGAVVGIVTCAVAWLSVVLMGPFMPPMHDTNASETPTSAPHGSTTVDAPTE